MSQWLPPTVTGAGLRLYKFPTRTVVKQETDVVLRWYLCGLPFLFCPFVPLDPLSPRPSTPSFSTVGGVIV